MGKSWLDCQDTERLAKACRSNILASYHRTSEDQKVRGAAWYLAAHSFARGLCDDHGLKSTDHSAGLIAALSPQQRWSVNIANATAFCIDPSARVHNDVQLDKALEIYDGSDWRKVLHGPKELSFADNISSPKRSSAVTVDRHAVRIALGNIAPTLDDAQRILMYARVYEFIVECYRTVAVSLAVSSLNLQAITWLEFREK